MKDKLFTGLILYGIAWLVFANFNIGNFKLFGSDTIVAYQLMPTLVHKKNFPSMLTASPITYRISDQIVVGQIGNFEPTKYTNCAVVDDENWTCTYDDKSGKFGFRDGDYYTEVLKGTNISHDWQSVSRFGYVWNLVEWSLADDSWLQNAIVLIIPFFT
ncbi:hypothetical protein [Magnetovibrio blakemorei]|uniref:Uncharacterized protein n=1 Tax=Magnetovibrio blakemorei TaxID=28181 RepID=A0A1E5QCA1_9PROT|nr:hypothetical protein [Magnetovibrio blakemorei]OEJ69629.1 hypothetical protein BEN30_01975 [Magnetovibrio blakemorei]